MAADRIQRRLAAILAADVVGYTRLMEADEVGTLHRVTALRSEIIEPLIARHHGRVVKLMGDGLLVEFASVVAAVTCAVEWQDGVIAHEAGQEPDGRISFRIAINLGDIIVEGDDIHGDGVNIAARLEPLAPPDGLCLSDDAWRQVRGKLDLPWTEMGPQRLKNVGELVTTYSLTRSAVAPRASKAAAKPSVAVLPFANMSQDPEQKYFSDGITEDLITDLSKVSGLFVIARNSSFSYKGQQVEVRQVAEELGVRYVLEGSVRRAGDRVRINAQLIDATTGGHLWAERYDGTMTDVFKLQDRVTAQIVAALSVTLSAGERALAEQLETSVPEAYDAFLAGWRHFRLRTVEDYRTALTWLEKAVTLDPDYGRAWAALASLYLEASQRGWLFELEIDYARLPDLLEKAMKRPTPLAYRVEAEILMQENRLDEAGAMLDNASALDPNDPDTHVQRSDLVAMQGDTDAAIALMKTAMRLDPHYPAFNLYNLGTHYLRAGDTAKAIELLERAQARNPADWVHLVYLTAAYAEADRLDDAEQTAKALVERRKELGFLMTLVGHFAYWSNLNGAFGERVLNGLRKAGIPEKVSMEDVNLSPEYRLSGAELREELKSGFRNKGRMPNGVWMRDMDPEGNGVHYWNGSQFATSTSEIRDDTQYTERSNGTKQSCTFYRDPKGTKENLDEFIAVCTNGVFPYARFPLPETTQ